MSVNGNRGIATTTAKLIGKYALRFNAKLTEKCEHEESILGRPLSQSEVGKLASEVILGARDAQLEEQSLRAFEQGFYRSTDEIIDAIKNQHSLAHILEDMRSRPSPSHIAASC